MQRFILRKKNQIALICLALILIGFVSKFGFKNHIIFSWALGIASFLGVLPIRFKHIRR